MKSEILVITTGGTIDAIAYTETPTNVTVKETSSIPDALEEHALGREYRYNHLYSKDSKEIDDNDIAEIAKIIEQSEEREIIITIGTDRIPEISRKLEALFPQEQQKKIIITGSMTPLSHGKEKSDGYKNLQKAAEDAHIMSPGVRVVMAGRLFEPEGLKKDFETKSFHQNLGEILIARANTQKTTETFIEATL